MTASLIPVLRRALAVGILLGLILLGWSVVVWPLIGMVVDRNSEIDTLSERLANLQAAIARIPDLKRREQALKERLDAEGGIWTGVSEAVMAATMQDRLREAVSSGDGAVRSTSHLQGTDEKDFRTVRVRFRIDGTLDTVQQTLAAIESARPAMFVDSMTIAAPANQPTEDKPPMLSLDLEVIGYTRKTEQ